MAQHFIVGAPTTQPFVNEMLPAALAADGASRGSIRQWRSRCGRRTAALRAAMAAAMGFSAAKGAACPLTVTHGPSGWALPLAVPAAGPATRFTARSAAAMALSAAAAMTLPATSVPLPATAMAAAGFLRPGNAYHAKHAHTAQPQQAQHMPPRQLGLVTFVLSHDSASFRFGGLFSWRRKASACVRIARAVAGATLTHSSALTWRYRAAVTGTALAMAK